MRQFPAFFPLEGRRVVVLGGGEIAARKLRLLAASPAEILVFADAYDTALMDEFAQRASLIRRAATRDDLDAAAFVIVAEDDPAAAEAGASLARDAGVPVNVVDRPALCDFTVPAIIDRDDVVIGVATGGAAPVIARDLRARIEALVPARLGALAAFAKSFREAVGAALPDVARRRAFWERTLRGSIADRFLAGDEAGAREAMIAAVARVETEALCGVVHIVGAGPGDPELLTLKALRILADADVIFYDRLVGPEVLDYARRDAERIYVGKAKADHAVPQDEIHARLIAAAREGKRVVRLKGGDPFVFGRGGEELDALRAAGVEAHVIPGVSSALGCAASAGIALTHRDKAQVLTLVTGHAKSGGAPDLDWAALTAANQTLVVFMGVGSAGVISDRLIAAGRDAATPVAVIENGTRPNEIVARGVLSGLGALIEDAGIKGPALLIIGEVARAENAQTLNLSIRSAA